MTLTFEHIVFDSRDAAALAGFWSRVLECPVDSGANEFFATVGRDGEALRPVFMFIKVPEERVGKNRLHVDLHATERDTEVKRVIGLGAEYVADFDEYGARWTTLRDPEGNLFDIGG
jgi:hypothetical protein